ncbi:MAG: hypothetical protein AB7U85_02065 [Alphaproteobacteria bacterium]
MPFSSEDLKKHLLMIIPQKVSEAILGYELFSKTEAPMDAKGFANYHSACKAAMAHIDTLLKLMKWAEKTQDEPSQDDIAEQLIADARAALADMEDE